MKHRLTTLISILLATCIALPAFADVIILKNGKSLGVFHVDIGSKCITYCETSDADAPIRQIPVEECFAVKIDDGEMRMIGGGTSSEAASRPQSQADERRSDASIAAAPDNIGLIASYSVGDFEFLLKPGSKEAKAAILFYRSTSASVLSSEEIEIDLVPGGSRLRNQWKPLMEMAAERNYGFCNRVEIQFRVKNKCDRPVYLNLEETTLNGPSIGYRAFYEGTQEVQSAGKGSGAAVNIGPLTVGGGSSNSKSVIKSEKSILIVPPRSSVTLPPKTLYDNYNREFYQMYDQLSNISEVCAVPGPLALLKENEMKTYSEEESQPADVFSLTYAFDKEYTDQKQMDVSLFVCRAIGLKRVFDVMAGRYEDQLKRITDLDDRMLVGTIKLR